MQAKIITTTDEFFKLKDDWERLQEQDEDVTYYSTFEYNWTWWEIYKNDKNIELFIVVVELINGTVIGIAPLIIDKIKKIVSYKIIRFLGRGDYLGIIIDRNSNIKYGNIIKEIFNFMESKNKCFERIILQHIRNDSRLAAYLLKSNMYNKNFKYLMECPILKYKKYKIYSEYKKEFVSKRDQNRVNKLQREVGYNFKVVFNDVENVYDKISELHIREQNYLQENKSKKERISLFNDKYCSKFIKKLYNNNHNVVTFLIEDFNGEILVFDTCYLYKRILHSWYTAYNTKYEKYSLGIVNNMETIKYIFENDIADITDLGSGRYTWKFKWTDDFIFDYKLDVWNEKMLKGKLLKKLYDIKKKIEFIWRKNG